MIFFGRRRGIWIALSFVLILGGCAPAMRGKVARFFFDGVPDDTVKTAQAAPAKPGTVSNTALPPTAPAEPKTYFHDPFLAQMCEECHNNKFSQKLRKEGKALCFTCHDDFTDQKKTVHYPVEEDMCLECHEPHQSHNERLLKKVVPEVCWNCHDNFAKEKGVVSVHPPMEEGMCLECHDPHATDNPRMFKEPVPALCWSCHDKDDTLAVPAHKDGGNCVQCHEAHASKKEKLLK